MTSGTLRVSVLVLLASALPGVSRVADGETAPSDAASGAIHLYLIGDAGEAGSGGEPALEELQRQASVDPERSLIVFLGDNIYPKGLPVEEAWGRREAERRLDVQIDVVQKSGARGIFIPGNHDWDCHGKDGWNAIRRQAGYVLERGGDRVSFLPLDGCPGPDVVDVGSSLRLVLLDTHWWLHKGPKPKGPDSTCASRAEEDVVAALRTILADAAGRRVVIAAHHPLVTGGSHGGHFNWQDHIFPLRFIRSWLYLPLPILGSLHPLIRKNGLFPQDISAKAYKRIIAAMERAFESNPPFVWVAGHDHGLQVIARGAARFIVSGAGSSSHNSAPHHIEGTQFSSGAAGFVRLEIGTEGAVPLTVTTMTWTGVAETAYETTLR